MELNAALPGHFGVAPPREKQPMPETFGALVVATAEVARVAAAFSPGQHDVARAALAVATGTRSDSISRAAPLADFFPPGRERFARWQRLRAAAPGLPEVTLNPWVENIAIYGFLACLIAVAVPIAQNLDRDEVTRVPDVPGIEVVGKKLVMYLFAGIIAVLMIPVYVIGRRYAARLPAKVTDVGSLAKYFPPPGAFSGRDAQSDAGDFGDEWGTEAVWDHLADLAARHLRQSPGSFRPDTRLRAPDSARL